MNAIFVKNVILLPTAKFCDCVAVIVGSPLFSADNIVIVKHLNSLLL